MQVKSLQNSIFTYIKHNVFSSFCFLGAFLICLFLLNVFIVQLCLPRLDALVHYSPNRPTMIYSHDHVKIAEFFKEKRYPVAFSQISSKVKKAFLAAEDKDFYSHNGVNWIGFTRACLHFISLSNQKQGGSTITQQLAKNLLLSRERTLSRKLRDILLARKIEARFQKDKIFEMYLNTIYLGNGAYGIEAAAQNYFHKSNLKLSLAEAAMIAGLAPAPSLYNPVVDFDAAKTRQLYVLHRMVENKWISKIQFRSAQKEKLTYYQDQIPNHKLAPYFVEEVLKIVEEHFGYEDFKSESLKIYTTLDARMQNGAQHAVKGFAQWQHERKNIQAAALIMDSASGAILAMVGGVDFQQSQFNRTIQAQRQIGSSVKPLYYAYAMEQGYSPASLVDSPEIHIGNWTPKNYGGEVSGRTTLLNALIKSYNIPSVFLYENLGPEKVYKYLSRFGFRWPKNDMTLALGSGVASPFQMVQAFSVFANQGKLTQGYLIERIVDKDNREIYSSKKDGLIYPEAGENSVATGASQDLQILTPQAAYVTLAMMENVVRMGSGINASGVSLDAAGKTGTTNDNTDAWFLGVTPGLVGGVWVGFDDPAKNLGDGGTGSQLGAPIWRSMMEIAVQIYPRKGWLRPSGLKDIYLDRFTGQVLDDSFGAISIPVIEGTEPSSPNAKNILAAPIVGEKLNGTSRVTSHVTSVTSQKHVDPLLHGRLRMRSAFIHAARPRASAERVFDKLPFYI